MPKSLIKLFSLALLVPALAAGCGEAAPGTVEVDVYGEDFIEEGIPAEEFADGWAVTFDTFLVTIGEVAVTAGHGAPALSEPAPAGVRSGQARPWARGPALPAR